MASTNGYGGGGGEGGGEGESSSTDAQQQLLLADLYPVNSLQELTLSTGETVSGRVYCTDEMTGSIVLQKALVHTTLASEIRIVHASNVTKASVLNPSAAEGGGGGGGDDDDDTKLMPLSQPLPKIHKKALEDRERRAIRLVEDSLRHINQKATPVGQMVFDRLLKACGEVAWKDDTSILVLNQVQVDAPYQPDNCKIVNLGRKGGNWSRSGGGLEERSLERVKKIVASVAAETTGDAGT